MFTNTKMNIQTRHSSQVCIGKNIKKEDQHANDSLIYTKTQNKKHNAYTINNKCM